MRKVLWPAIAIVLTAATAAAQSMASSQSVLSTMPSPPAGAVSVPAEMSGVPLQVGDLPPGMVSVRVIRDSFQNNIANQTVQLRIVSTDRVLSDATGADGRAVFDGLSVGDIVAVRTTLAGELLESQSFPIPSQGGVRLVLVAGTGAAAAGADPWPETSAMSGVMTAAWSESMPPDRQARASAVTPTSTYVVFGAVMSLVAGAVVLWPRAIRRKSCVATSGVLGSSAVQPGDQRSVVFEQLVQLEKDYEAGRLAAGLRTVRREALIQELLSFQPTLASKPIDSDPR